MKHNRFGFWRIFWVLLVLYISFALLGIVIVSLTPDISKEFNWSKFLNAKYLISQLSSFAFSLIFYFYTLNVFYRLFASKKRVSYYIKPIAIAFIAMCVYYVVTYFAFTQEQVRVGINESGFKKAQFPIALLFVFYTVGGAFFVGVSLLLSYLTYLRDEKKQRKILEAQKMQLEVEKSQANFNFLKAQINPHFLHNTLNFLYAKALPLSPELSEGILTLSDIMRYALSEGNAKDGKAPLKDEIEHVRNVIKIQQLRFNNNLNVQFDVEGVVNGATIIPFVLITLVENAFKHGDLKSNEVPINVKVKVDGGKIHFYCRNKKKTGPKELSTGIGLDNIKKRLELAYGNKYELNIKDESEIYSTELIIDLV